MSAERPRAVFLTPIMPDESGNGLAMRMGMFAEALGSIAALHVIVIPVVGGPIEPSPLIRHLGCKIDVVPVGPAKTPWFDALDRIADPETRLALFREGGEPTLAGYLTREVKARVETLINRFPADIIHVGRAYLAPLVQLGRAARFKSLDLDEADIYSFALQAAALERAGHRLRACWTEHEGKVLDQMIVRHGDQYDRIFVSSGREAGLLKQAHSRFAFDVVPNAVRMPVEISRSDDGASLGFIGSFGFEPNVHSIVQFCRETWSIIVDHVDDARLFVAGRNPPRDVLALGSVRGVEVLGEIDRVDDFYARTTLAIAPISAGGGTRIKLLEASAHGVPWVATEIGAAGIDWPLSTGGWIAPAGQHFASACIEALRAPDIRKEYAACGRNFVAENYNRSTTIRDAASLFVAGLK